LMKGAMGRIIQTSMILGFIRTAANNSPSRQSFTALVIPQPGQGIPKRILVGHSTKLIS
jgi:hypothetical protein